MKRLIVPLCVLLLSTTALAQTRSRTTRSRGTQRKPAATQNSEVRSEGASRVAEQIKNLTRFVYLLGGVAKGIEDRKSVV